MKAAASKGAKSLEADMTNSGWFHSLFVLAGSSLGTRTWGNITITGE